MTENVKKEIERLHGLIQGWEDTDPAFLQFDLKELRHKIMYVHLRIEASLNILIGDYVSEAFIAFVKGEKLNGYKTSLQMFRWDLQKLLDEMDFAKKVKVALKTNKIDKKTQGRLFKVNDLRVIFSHPQAHQEEIQAFREQTKHLEALEILVAGFEAINAIFAEREKNDKQQ
jgi:hypothetical protein